MDASHAADTHTMDLTVQLLQHLKGDNVLVSPVSIATALRLVLAGADGRTAKEIQAVVGKECLPQLENVTLVNKVYVRDDIWLLEAYKRALVTDYNTSAEQVSFHNKQAICDKVNATVCTATHGMIKDALKPSMLTGSIALLLVNAIYFKGLWQHSFRETCTEPFYLANGKTIMVPMLRSDIPRRTWFSSKRGFAILLPYKEKDVAMVIILPNISVDYFIKKLKPSVLRNMLHNLRNAEKSDCWVMLPKFKMESSHQLNETLMKLGIREAFGAKCNFTKMSPSSNIGLSDMHHKACLEVDEVGTRAAAATMTTVCDGMGGGPTRFYVNRPFVLLLMHRDTVLFAGYVHRPT